MKPLNFSTFVWLVLSFVLAILLNIIPLTPKLVLFYPLWMPLLLIYWVMVLPEHIHFSLAWGLGLIIDVLHGSYLGEHSFALCVITFLAYRLHLRFRMFPLMQQMLFVFILLFIYVGLLVSIQVFLNITVQFRWLWVPLITSTFMWPVLQKILKISAIDMRQH